MKQEVTTKKVFIRTLGCQMNVRDAEVIGGLLKKEGFKIVESSDTADVVILVTCSVRQHAEDKVWSEVGRIAKFWSRGKKGNAKRGTRPVIGVVGCMAQNYKEAIFERAPEVDFVAGPSDIDKIPEMVKKCFGAPAHQGIGLNLFERKLWETEGMIRPEEIYHTGFYEDKNHAYVVISEGCSNYCSYCVVPYVRGELHHRDCRDIMREIKEAVTSGVTRVTLLGQNVNAYVSNPEVKNREAKRRDENENEKPPVSFAGLLKMVNGIEGLKEFSFITSHPRDTTAELFKTMVELDKLKKYLHLPVQAGSDKILKLMNRGYSRNFYLDLARNYRTIVTGGMLTTDIIV
ncbi:MAG: MiaB/RimO family radical SAM methylthiotransferase, partial [Candidatus Omnitrophota bacterium]